MEYIGILLDNMICNGIPYGRTGAENISFYEKAAKLYGLTPCFFRLKDINSENNEVTAYVKDSLGNYEKKRMPLPRVIHNRGLYFSKKYKDYLLSLVEKGLILYNQWNRYRKLEVYNILKKHNDLIENIPETQRGTKDNIMEMLSKHSSLIIKPDSGSLGMGLMKIEKHESENILTMLGKGKEELLKIPFTDDIPKELKNKISYGNYIVQEYIDLATYKGKPFDLRVTCQKNHLGRWQMTGIYGKVAKGGSFVTNVARGGSAYQLGALLQDTVFDEKKMIERIEQVSLNISKVLEGRFQGLADIGMDVGVTTEGTIKFIECNGRDLRYGFKNADMYDTWENTYINPIGYGKFLLERRCIH